MADHEKTQEREIYHPNRLKAAVKLTRAVVIVLLLVSVGLMVVVTAGGWSAMEGMKPALIAFVLLYVVMVVFALRWSRGMLPVSAALGVILAIFALVSAPGWFARDKTGFVTPALPESLLGLLCVVIAGVQVLLLVFSMRGFTQGWNVEEERSSRSGRRGQRDRTDAQPHAA